MQNLKDTFDAVPRGEASNQYAVVAINTLSGQYLWPLLNPNTNAASVSGVRNYVYAIGSGGAQNHAEYQIADGFPAVWQRYQNDFGDVPVRISVYSVLGPCPNCATRLSNMLPAGARGGFAFSDQWANNTDSDAYDAFRILQGAGYYIYRTCGAGQDCRTFQRVLHTCASSVPMICKDCQNRPNGIAQWINDTMAAIKTRDRATWVEKAEEVIYTNPMDKQIAVNGWTACFTRAAAYPVEGLIGAVANVDPSGDTPPTNWPEITGAAAPPAPGPTPGSGFPGISNDHLSWCEIAAKAGLPCST
jgi:hypothetical protein